MGTKAVSANTLAVAMAMRAGMSHRGVGMGGWARAMRGKTRRAMRITTMTAAKRAGTGSTRRWRSHVHTAKINALIPRHDRHARTLLESHEDKHGTGDDRQCDEQATHGRAPAPAGQAEGADKDGGQEECERHGVHGGPPGGGLT